MSTFASMEGHIIAPLGAGGTFTRRQLEDQIERAIAALDAMDGDPDMEPDEDGEDSHDREYDLTDVEVYHWPAVVGPQDCGPVRIRRAA